MVHRRALLHRNIIAAAPSRALLQEHLPQKVSEVSPMVSMPQGSPPTGSIILCQQVRAWIDFLSELSLQGSPPTSTVLRLRRVLHSLSSAITGVEACNEICYKDPVLKDHQWSAYIDRSPVIDTYSLAAQDGSKNHQANRGL